MFSKIFLKNAFENVVCKMFFPFVRLKYVNILSFKGYNNVTKLSDI